MHAATRRERATAQSENDRAAYEARKRPAYLPPCPSSAVLLSRACGHKQAALIKCHSPLCPDCERERAARIRDKWEATLAALPNLKLMTLTIGNGHDLAERIATLRTARRQFLDLRLGRNNRRRIKRATIATIARQLAAGKIDGPKASAQLKSTKHWFDAVARTEKKNGKSPKVRALLRGLASMEITHNDDTGMWHAHLHCIVSMRYMPQVVLQTLWHMATRGAGRIVDIRKIDDVGAGIAETMKYATKPGNIPDALGPAVIAALRGVRRLTRIGNIKPIEPEPLPCPGCERPACECGSLYAGMVSVKDIDFGNIESGAFITHIYDNGMSYDARVSLHRNIKGQLVWTATTLAGGDMVLSTQMHSVSREGSPSPPTGPPMGDDEAARELQAIGARP